MYYKDLKKRSFLKKKELNILILKYLIKNGQIANKERYLYILYLNQLNIKFFLNNHCLLTKNNISINRFSFLSRSNFKNLIHCGYFNNVRKSSW